MSFLGKLFGRMTIQKRKLNCPGIYAHWSSCHIICVMNVYKNIFVDNKLTIVIDMAGWMFRRIIGLFRVSNALLYLFSIISLVTYRCSLVFIYT